MQFASCRQPQDFVSHARARRNSRQVSAMETGCTSARASVGNLPQSALEFLTTCTAATPLSPCLAETPKRVPAGYHWFARQTRSTMAIGASSLLLMYFTGMGPVGFFQCPCRPTTMGLSALCSAALIWWLSSNARCTALPLRM